MAGSDAAEALERVPEDEDQFKSTHALKRHRSFRRRQSMAMDTPQTCRTHEFTLHCSSYDLGCTFVGECAGLLCLS